MAERELWTVPLGRVPYGEALELQRSIAKDRISGAIPQDVLLLVEHPPVVTLGRSSKEKHLVASPDFLESQGVELFEVERGGDVTFHGPGQLVGYPIIDLKRHRQDLHWYLRKIEEALINTLADYGIPGERNTAYTGVWTRGKKIASIGVHARDWVTWHGFALNVTTDLSYLRSHRSLRNRRRRHDLDRARAGPGRHLDAGRAGSGDRQVRRGVRSDGGDYLALDTARNRRVTETLKVYPPRARAESTGTLRDFAAELNPQQAAAATHGDGPLLIIAGAGTGKTRTLVYRVWRI